MAGDDAPRFGGGHAVAARYALEAAQQLIASALASLERDQTAAELAMWRRHAPDDADRWAAEHRRLYRAPLDVDMRQPGGVPGPGPGDLPERALADEVSTPAPEYRAPLEGTMPPPGREWRCASCARRRPGHGGLDGNPVGPSRCSCGGEWMLCEDAVMDPEWCTCAHPHAHTGPCWQPEPIEAEPIATDPRNASRAPCVDCGTFPAWRHLRGLSRFACSCGHVVIPQPPSEGG